MFLRGGWDLYSKNVLKSNCDILSSEIISKSPINHILNLTDLFTLSKSVISQYFTFPPNKLPFIVIPYFSNLKVLPPGNSGSVSTRDGGMRLFAKLTPFYVRTCRFFNFSAFTYAHLSFSSIDILLKFGGFSSVLL